jgi:hypothetical protein
MQKLDSSNRAVRAVERWKRGFAAMVMIGLVTLLGYLAYGLALTLLAETVLSEGWQVTLAFVTTATVLPWCFGNRAWLRTIGSLASIPDNSSHDRPADEM